MWTQTTDNLKSKYKIWAHRPSIKGTTPLFLKWCCLKYKMTYSKCEMLHDSLIYVSTRLFFLGIYDMTHFPVTEIRHDTLHTLNAAWLSTMYPYTTLFFENIRHDSFPRERNTTWLTPYVKSCITFHYVFLHASFFWQICDMTHFLVGEILHAWLIPYVIYGVTFYYGVATTSRLLKITGLFCRIQSLLQGSFADETNLEKQEKCLWQILDFRTSENPGQTPFFVEIHEHFWKRTSQLTRRRTTVGLADQPRAKLIK